MESQEVIHLPGNMIGRVLLRNSRISLSQEDEIASIMFIQPDQAPETPYDGAFQNELNFRSLGNYEPELAKEMTELEK